jgi:recombination associated protein RdgC
MSVWFKQLKVFQYQMAEPLDALKAEEHLQAHQLQPCPSVSQASSGWMSPFGKSSDVMCHAVQGYWLMSFVREERLLPASVLREQLDEKINEIQTKQERTVYAKEKANLRDELQFQLLPKAFTRKQATLIYLDTKNQLLMISTTNQTRCQQIIELLNTTFGGFKAYPVEVKDGVASVMTSWLRENRWPKGFIIERDCEMFDEEHEKSIIKFQQQNLAAKEVIEHINKGHKLQKLSMSWQDKIAFTLDHQLNFSRIKFLDLMEQKRQDEFCDSAMQQIDVDFSIMAMEFAQMLPAVFDLFSGAKPFSATESVTQQEHTEAVGEFA